MRACGKETPFARNALQYELAEILELESRTCDQIIHCLRDEDLGRARYRPTRAPMVTAMPPSYLGRPKVSRQW